MKAKSYRASKKNPTATEWLRGRGACEDGVAFARQFKTMAEVWDKCECPDWTLWIARQLKLELNTPAIRLFACACVRGTPVDATRTVWDLLKDPRSKTAVEVAERFAKGKATAEELGQARSAAADAAAYAATADAAYAAYAAADADAATAAAYAAADADAYAAAAYAAADADAYAARAKARKWQAAKLRRFLKNPFTH